MIIHIGIGLSVEGEFIDAPRCSASLSKSSRRRSSFVKGNQDFNGSLKMKGR